MKKQLIIIAGLLCLLFTLQSCQAKHEKNGTIDATSIDGLQKAATNPADRSQPKLAPAAPVLDFRIPTKRAMPGVVHIISTYQGREAQDEEIGIDDLFKDFFGEDFWHKFQDPEMRPWAGSGSGIIITEEGYVLTNYHVIKNADEIEVILNDGRSYFAKVAGTDPPTDLALLHIDEKDLPFVKLGDSDKIEIGEWVLAMGNPFNLTTTVTAGIVSAKGRNINIIQEKTSIESFIQTDAAVNRGNSGGALVNIDGELIGVITAIASPTGAYAGYSFAIPVNIARKVVDDLIKYGEVQRAYLGAYIRNLNSRMAEELHLNITQGVYIDSLVPEGSAEEAGLRKSDVIIKINDEDINNTSRLQEVIGRHRPGDKIKLNYMRGNNKETVEVLLKGKSGELETVKKERPEILKSLGIEIESLSASERKKLNLEGGVKVTKIYPGKISWETEMRDGFIITKVDKKKTYSAETFIKKIKEIKGGVLLEGVYPEKPEKVYYYAFGM